MLNMDERNFLKQGIAKLFKNYNSNLITDPSDRAYIRTLSRAVRDANLKIRLDNNEAAEIANQLLLHNKSIEPEIYNNIIMKSIDAKVEEIATKLNI